MVLLVEDDSDWLEIYLENLRDEDYIIHTARTVNQALNLISMHLYHAIVTDLKMLGFNDDFGGFNILKKTKELGLETQVVVITAYGTQEIAFRATQQGAYDYVVKPPIPDKFRMSVKRAIQASLSLMQKRKTSFNYDGETKYSSTNTPVVKNQKSNESVIGNSKNMLLLFDQISIIANSKKPILIWGEAGTGKRLIARTIHTTLISENPRFSEISCTKLVNYKKTIFSNLKSLLDYKSTLFLHDLRQLDEEGQNVLVELLEFVKDSNIQIIASLTTPESNIALALEKNRIRQTIVLNFSQNILYVPPLRARKEDIPALAGYFVNLIIKDKFPVPHISLSPEAINSLISYNYLNKNVQELYEILTETIKLLGGSGTILPEHLPILDSEIIPTETKTNKLSKLRQSISRFFNESELRNLCFDLEIEYENLPGTAFNDKVRELISYCNRHQRLDDLIKTCKLIRSNFEI